MKRVDAFRLVWTVVSLRHEIIIVVRTFDLDTVMRSSRIASGVDRTVPLHKPRILSKPWDRKVKPTTILFRCSFIKFAEPQPCSLLESDNDIIELNLQRLRRLLLKIQGQLALLASGQTTVSRTRRSASASCISALCTHSIVPSDGFCSRHRSMISRFISFARS